MKRARAWVIAAAAALLILCGILGWELFRYALPAGDDVVYDLSMMWEGEAMPDGWEYDQKGWTVFAQEGAEPVPLQADGFGGFSGELRAGQTVYFSRVLTEKLDGGPVLQIDAYSQNVAVFLDGKLIYTDRPEQDNRIGYLALPEREQLRETVLTVSLPDDCAGKVLTIAQSTPVLRDTAKVWPVPVSLSCRYAYESGLIAESFRTAVFAALLFAAGAALLLFFLRGLRQGRRDTGLLWEALSLLLWMAAVLLQPSFTGAYRGNVRVNWHELCLMLALTALLAFFTSRAGRLRRAFWALTGLMGLCCAMGVFIDLRYEELHNDWLIFLRTSVPQMTGFIGLCAVLVCAWACWRRERRFYAFFAPIGTAAVGAVLLAAAIGDGGGLLEQFALGIAGLTPAYFLWPMMLTLTGAAAVALAIELTEQEIDRRARLRLMKERSELTMASYESLRTQNEQVMMLLHDMNKHFGVLRQMTGEENIRGYLDELLLQNEKIRPVIQSGHPMLDVMLNGKLTQAISAGVRIDVVRAQAPAALPLNDTELCSLVMNLLDNAVAGAVASDAEKPYIRLDMHTKSSFFVFCLENSAREKREDEQNKKPAPGHGLGLKIVRQVVDRYGGLLEMEQDEHCYRVRLALPLG